VRGELGEETQRIVDLEVARHAAEEIGAGGPGEPATGPLLGQAQDLAFVGGRSRGEPVPFMGSPEAVGGDQKGSARADRAGCFVKRVVRLIAPLL
jgi:hypothetical protein